MKALVERMVLAMLRGYQIAISPFLTFMGVRCRFHPSCSQYALEAVTKYGIWQGLRKASARLLRCHPWHPGGFDPP